ncbi:hypothetical protein HK103_007094 [Boothiomyces macroporosus]|uniref:Exocyst complex component Sec3 PIP2-binding N-terminal domain-containing protein n=1 Tax=Boothiomyces macroporosus TaxID=261099 RepID=A0AAD5Y671_9FUNG|nr:hypothetical protein HK103_007094 [Boothiomyces macroporosus]
MSRAQDRQLRQQLTANLFPSKSDSDAERLLYSARVIEGGKEKDVNRMLDMFKTFQAEDDDEEEGKGRGKGTKVRLTKVKQTGTNSFSIIKSWNLDDVKSVEFGSNECQITIQIGKPYTWLFNSMGKKLSEKYNAKKAQMKLVNFDEELIQEQMTIVNEQNAAIDAQGDATEEKGEYMEELEDEIIDDLDAQFEIELPHVDLDVILSDFNWNAKGDAAALEAKLVTELQALEAVIKMGNDVHQIEAQNKGMQQTASNQKALLQELDSFISSLKVPGYLLEVLQNEPLDSADGIRECETAIEKVMNIIRSRNDDYGEMDATHERVSFLQGHANQFTGRICDFLTQLFAAQNLKLHGHENLEAKLFKFKKILTWVKEIDARKHYDLQMSYVKEVARAYRKEIGEFLEAIKTQHLSKRTGQEELDFLFIGHVSVSSAATNVLKSAVGISDKGTGGIKQKFENWRIKKVKKGNGFKEEDDDDESEPDAKRGLKRSDSIASGATGLDDDRMSPDEALGHALLKLTNIMIREQNFLMDFFGIVKNVAILSSSPATGAAPDDQATEDEAESLQKWQSGLSQPRQTFKDPKAEKRIIELLDIVFQEVRDLVMANIDAGLKHDQSYSVGMMVNIEYHLRENQNTCHTYILNLLDSLSRKVNILFEKFVYFVDRMEKMLSNWDGTARKQIDKAYAKILKCIFETFEAEAQQAGADSKNASDEKEFLNMHILSVENMHHLYSELKTRRIPSLDSFAKQAKILYDVNLEAYCKVVIRKPLGKLLEFFEGVEGLLKTGPPDEVAYHVQYSKSALKDVIKKYPGKELKKSLEVLYKKVEKHYSDNASLLQVVWAQIQIDCGNQVKKYEDLITKCYPELAIRLDFTKKDLDSYFAAALEQ